MNKKQIVKLCADNGYSAMYSGKNGELKIMQFASGNYTTEPKLNEAELKEILNNNKVKHYFGNI